MKKIAAIIVVSLCVLVSFATVGAAVTVNNTKPTQYTVLDDKQDDVRAFFLFGGPLVNKLFNHIDMLSFSIYEDPATPQFLYMKMAIGEVKYTERRSLYNIIWEYHGLEYFTGMHVLNRTDILDYSGYFDADGVEHKIWNTSVSIDEASSVLTWTITKSDLGLHAGDVFVKPYAQSSFGTKDWETFKSFAKDKIPSGPDYVIQY